VASGYAVWYVGRAVWEVEGWNLRLRSGRRIAAAMATGSFAIVMVGALIYPWSGTAARQAAAFPGAPSGTLDGLAYLPHGQFTEDKGTDEPADDVTFSLGDDAPLIDWLRNDVKGSPVIVEAVGPLYHWTGRISWNTGLPAVIGWDWHQIQQRTAYEALIQTRRADVTRFYTTEDQSFIGCFLDKYNVSYVVVGTEEYAFGSPDGLQALAVSPALKAVFRSGKYVIYEVVRDSPLVACAEPPAVGPVSPPIVIPPSS
jgi:uncharacterized membrane protein